jgi:hypothetical protein
MKAAVIREHGKPRFDDFDDPVAGNGQVVVEVAAAALNHSLGRAHAGDGFAVFHAPFEIRRDAYLRLTEHAARREIVVDLEELPLAKVEEAWARQQEGAESKLVLIP